MGTGWKGSKGAGSAPPAPYLGILQGKGVGEGRVMIKHHGPEEFWSSGFQVCCWGLRSGSHPRGISFHFWGRSVAGGCFWMDGREHSIPAGKKNLGHPCLEESRAAKPSPSPLWVPWGWSRGAPMGDGAARPDAGAVVTTELSARIPPPAILHPTWWL